MSPAPESPDARPDREPFVARWTGALAVGLFIYIPITLLLTFAEGSGGPAFEIFKLYSDFPASLGSAVLAMFAATASDRARGQAHLGVPRGIDRGLHGRQPAELHLLDVRHRPVPLGRRRLLPRLLPAPLHRHPRCRARGDRARAVGPPRARRDHPDAGLRRLLLVLRDRAGRGGGSRPGRLQVRPDPELHRAQLPDAARLRHPADARGHRRDRAAHADPPHDRLLHDVARRHRLGHGQGHRHLPAGRPVRRALPVLLCLRSLRPRANSCAVRR